MRILSISALLLLLFGCSSLPAPARQDTKVIAVYLKVGTMSVNSFRLSNYYLTVDGVQKPFWLRAGLNFITVDSATDTAVVRGFRASSDLSAKAYTWFSESVYFPVRFPLGSSLALVQAAFVSEEVKTGNSYRMYGRIREMPDEQAQAILEGWKKEKAASQWTNLFIATR